jgi:hypothetical protein
VRLVASGKVSPETTRRLRVDLKCQMIKTKVRVTHS